MARKPDKTKGRHWEHSLDVIGLKFRWKRDVRRALSDLIDKRGSVTGIKLVREPDNEYDANAIAVYLPERVFHGKQLGYIRRDSAAVLAPHLDSGTTVFKRATLNSLYEDDDYNSGDLTVYFHDPEKRSTKRKIRT